MKLDIIGNIKIDEKNPVKVRQTLACIRSYQFLKSQSTFWLNIESASPEMYSLVKKTLSDCRYQFQLTNYSEPNFGAIYCEMLNDSQADYVINFESDHFMLFNLEYDIERIIDYAKDNNVDIIRSSFHKIERKSCENILDKGTANFGKIFEMNQHNFHLFNHAYPRYFLGTNGIFKREFALKFWSRKFDSKKPHEWEVSGYNDNFSHICMVPKVELQVSIEDDHGEDKTCLFSRTEKRFWDIYNSIQLK